jgi:predicted O-methyltransferase YrrM
MADSINDTNRAKLDDYVTELYVDEDEALEWIQFEAERNGLPAISVRPFEGRLLQMLVYMSGAKNMVEIGALAGYSGTWLARALPPDSKLYTLEKSSKHAAIARASFQRAGVSSRIELLEGDALDSLKKLTPRGPFDLVFIDADKGGYPAYLEWAVANLRPGGLVAAHNAFRGGRILEPSDEADKLMDLFNHSLANDDRLESMILAIGDGLAVGVKKAGY